MPRWFQLADIPMPPVLQGDYWTDPEPNFVFQAVNADLLKGLAWASSSFPDSDVARALAALAVSAYRSMEGFGPRAEKVGNGCIWALGNMPGMAGLAQLSILKVKLRKARPQAMIFRALQAAAQRDRIESLYLERKKWLLPIWRERYVDHPLVGTIARRLIWKFSQGDRAASGIWWEGRIVGRDGQPIDWLSDKTTVELWHPIHVEPDVVLEWRQWLLQHAVQQPFKQAHREVYFLTDVDLFVGVTSVGNDPGWIEGRAQGRDVDYWYSYSVGELGETAKTRRAVLESLLPRLKIGARCLLSDKFLVVRGDIRTYKIHLGSGNILMEPNNRYLCIVPSPHNMASLDRIFLPFEGDVTLAIILSKAFLLADDTKITDPTIMNQLHR